MADLTPLPHGRMNLVFFGMKICRPLREPFLPRKQWITMFDICLYKRLLSRHDFVRLLSKGRLSFNTWVHVIEQRYRFRGDFVYIYFGMIVKYKCKQI